MQWDSSAFLWWLGSKKAGYQYPFQEQLPLSEQHQMYSTHTFSASSIMLKANYQLNINVNCIEVY